MKKNNKLFPFYVMNAVAHTTSTAETLDITYNFSAVNTEHGFYQILKRPQPDD